MKHKVAYISLAIAAAFAVLAYSGAASAQVKADYLYNLSNFTGTIPYNWVRVLCDKETNEAYVINTTDRTIKIFNENGMEVYSFGDDDELGDVTDVTMADNGDMLFLSYIKGKYAVILGNYRGEPKTRVELKNLPKETASNFSPSNIVYRAGHIYLADKTAMRVVVTDKTGVFEKSFDIAKLLNLDDKQRSETGLVGFSLDKDGNMLLTVPTLFTACVVSQDGKLKSFGVRGSAPGKFNVVSAIVADDKGYYYIADTLRCVVMVFDKEFKFQTEFGYRGFDPGNLIAPSDLAVDNTGKVYVTQGRRRGVSVYRVSMGDTPVKLQ
jgi:DNA-binding beta-propeller fold protein YncE